MPEVTFNSTDNPEALAAQQEAEAQALATGERLIAEEEAIIEGQYRKARSDAEADVRYAGKFKSAEELEKAYKELEKKLGQQSQEDSTNDTSDDDGDEVRDQEGSEGDEGDNEEVDENVDFIRKASEEYWANEKQLKPETIQRLKELPSEKLIEAYLELTKDSAPATVQPLDEAAANEILQSVGGQEAYNATLAWATENLKPEEVAAYDNVLNSGNKDAIYFAVQALNKRYLDAVGFEGQTVSGKAGRSTGPKPFRSQAELSRAIRDPRYHEDPAYRNDVAARLEASGDLL